MFVRGSEMPSSLHWPSAILLPQTLFRRKIKFGRAHNILRPQVQLLLHGTSKLVQFA